MLAACRRTTTSKCERMWTATEPPDSYRTFTMSLASRGTRAACRNLKNPQKLRQPRRCASSGHGHDHAHGQGESALHLPDANPKGNESMGVCYLLHSTTLNMRSDEKIRRTQLTSFSVWLFRHPCCRTSFLRRIQSGLWLRRQLLRKTIPTIQRGQKRYTG